MSKETIGVIVPVYNSEKYVAECIESILTQTYTNFRLILVDDGSPDKAGAICDYYAAKDKRITVIHQENAGVTRARAQGVQEASDCEYIAFVDSDDTISREALELLYNAALGDITTSLIDNKYTPKNNPIKFDDYISMLLHDESMTISLCGKLYRRALFSEKIFDIPRAIRASEDIITNLNIAFCSDRKDIVYITQNLYNYRVNLESTSNTFARSIEYEQMLHEEKMRAIPADLRERYLKETIKLRLSKWRIKWGWKYCCDNMKETVFYKTLSNDIRSTGYKLNIWDKILLYNTNPIIRFAAVTGRKINNYIITLCNRGQDAHKES